MNNKCIYVFGFLGLIDKYVLMAIFDVIDGRMKTQITTDRMIDNMLYFNNMSKARDKWACCYQCLEIHCTYFDKDNQNRTETSVTNFSFFFHSHSASSMVFQYLLNGAVCRVPVEIRKDHLHI